MKVEIGDRIEADVIFYKHRPPRLLLRNQTQGVQTAITDLQCIGLLMQASLSPCPALFEYLLIRFKYLEGIISMWRAYVQKGIVPDHRVFPHQYLPCVKTE